MELNDLQIKWLKETVKIQDDNRGIIFLSHHQYFSAFEGEEYHNPGKTLSDIVGSGRTVLWFWGHEHRLALYGSNQFPGGSIVFARCIGNGGMPVELNHVPKNNQNPSNAINRNLALYDKRKRNVVKGNIPLGYNGYLILKLNNNNLIIEYYDDNDVNQQGITRKILEEKWSVESTTGQLVAQSIINHIGTDENGLTVFSGDINSAIK